MVILKGKIFKHGNSYAKRVNKSIVDANIVKPGETYESLLLSPNLSSEQKEFLDLLVNRIGSHMIATGKKPEEFKFLVEEEDGTQKRLDGEGVRPRPTTSRHTQRCPVGELDSSEPTVFGVRHPHLIGQCGNASPTA